MKTRQFFSLSVLMISMFFIVSVGSAAPQGQWKVDPESRKIIESGVLLPNHTYYYTGSINGPDCFMAIDNQYTLRKSVVWAKPDEMSQKVLKEWLQFMVAEGGPRASTLRGGVILTPDGKKSGVWLSHYPVNIVEMPKPGELEIYQPHPIGGNPAGQGA